MPKFTYLFIEDKEEQLTKDIIDYLQAENAQLIIKYTKPLPFKEALKELPKQKYDGLLLDLRLDEESDAEYRAFTLAQEIRTRTTEGSKAWVDVPIVICSTDPKLQKSYNKNIAGQDLFDKKYLKNEDIVDSPEIVSNELVALAKGYIYINKIKVGKRSIKISDFFGLNEVSLAELNENILHFSLGTTGILPTHEYARFILRELIEKPGELIDKYLLYARLGLDFESTINENFIYNVLKKFIYKGPFNEAWNRWWWPLINKWWFTTFKGQPGLVNLNAEDRVALINEKFKLRLVAAKPIEVGYNKKFWTVCRMLNQPLNPFDGYLIEQGFEPFPWQEKAYISRKAALEPASKAKGFFLHPSDKERLDDLKRSRK